MVQIKQNNEFVLCYYTKSKYEICLFMANLDIQIKINFEFFLCKIFKYNTG